MDQVEGLCLPRNWDEPDVDIWILESGVCLVGYPDGWGVIDGIEHWEFAMEASFAADVAVRLECGIDDLSIHRCQVGRLVAVDIRRIDESALTVSLLSGLNTIQFTSSSHSTQRLGRALRFAADWLTQSWDASHAR